MLRRVVGLRTNTAVFLLLLLGPALLLAWLGFAAAVPLEQELLRNAKAMTLRAATAFAASLPGRLAELLERERGRLEAAAAALATGLPATGATAFAEAEATFGWPLVLRRASGEVLLPAPPRDLALPFLDEWPAYRAFEAVQLDPAQRREAHHLATTFVAPSLRVRALATVPETARGTLEAAVRDVDDDTLVAAGPRVVERLLAGENGRQRLVAKVAVLYAMPATEERRLAWFEAIGATHAAARQRLRIGPSEGAVLRADLPAGAEIHAFVAAPALCEQLAATIEECVVRCEPGEPDQPAHAAAGADTVARLGLKSIAEAIAAGRTWDAVVDTSGYVPRIVGASAELLKPAARQYVFVSSISAYADARPSGIAEDAAVATIADPANEDVGTNYGALKALCEQAAEKAFPGRTTNVRPGYIVGPKDATNRFAWWPARTAKGGKVLAPPRQDPIQVIDVRDLAEFLVHCAENETMGVFNAVGPARVLTMGELLDACNEVTGAKAEFVCADGAFLAAQQADGLPIWTRPGSEFGGFGAVANQKAVAAGLKFRPLLDTVRATWEWWNGIAEPAKAAMWDSARTGRPTPEREAEVIAAWLARAKDGQDKDEKAGGKRDD